MTNMAKSPSPCPGLDKLLDGMETRPPPRIQGKWCIIQIDPTLYREERINIGVAFRPLYGRKIFSRLLPSLNALGALYGEQSLDNLNFMLSILRKCLHDVRKVPDVSPHISFGQWKYASGNSVEEILDNMFKLQVAPLDWKKTEVTYGQ